MNNNNCKTVYYEREHTEMIPIITTSWIKKVIKVKTIGVQCSKGKFGETCNFKVTYPRSCEVCGNVLKNKDTWFNHVVNKHGVTAVYL